MTQGKNTGSAKNQSAAGSDSSADLNIPTLGAAAAQSQAQPPQQVMQQAQAGAGDAQGGPAIGGGLQEPRTLADIQRMADSAAKPVQAMHRPVNMPRDREQTADNDRITLEMPISGSLDAMRRTDQYIEPVADMGRFKDKAAELAFLEEMLIIRIHESNDPTAEDPVQLGVNGRNVFIKRGEDVIVRRKYVEQLLRAKPEHVSTRIERDGSGNPRNFIDKTRALKYPFSIIRDDNPRGRAWERKIRTEA